MAYVKIGGTNGSGKTCLARAFMKLWDFKPECFTGKTKVAQYVARVKPGQPLSKLFNKVVVLGSYETVCGGMDTINDKNILRPLVEQYCTNKDKRTLVFLEGLLVGGTYGYLGELSERSKVPWLYGFMDTPYDVCVSRVEARRLERGNDKPFDGMRSLHGKIRGCKSTAARAASGGHVVVWIDHKLSPERQVKALLKDVERMMVRK